uniref:Uncharacterized protein n=1 Tax=Meloidogyne enterolobii TaxID=390850 RepID=A0A6V7WKK0_MELEN|nr:unnamed protein product [Meloidogyne enterolobii]
MREAKNVAEMLPPHLKTSTTSTASARRLQLQLLLPDVYNFNCSCQPFGRKFDDPAVQSDMKHWPFKVIKEKVLVQKSKWKLKEK